MRFLKRELGNIDQQNAKKITAYKENSQYMQERHSKLVSDVGTNLTQFKEDFQRVKSNFSKQQAANKTLEGELKKALQDKQSMSTNFTVLQDNTTS